MKFSELPQSIQAELNEKRERREKSQLNTATEILLYNPQFTRYLWAKRHSYPSQYSRFGGGNYWEVEYGEIVFCKSRVFEDLIEWDWGFGKKYGKVNGIEIPKQIDKKAQIIEIINKIGLFDIKKGGK